MQEKELIHRDVKPDNILVDKDSNVKLLDFQFIVSNNRGKLAESREMKAVNQGVRSLGQEYRFADYHWDDAYSFAKIIKELSLLDSSELIRSDLTSVEQYIGNLSFSTTSGGKKKVGLPGLIQFVQMSRDKAREYQIRILGIRVIYFRKYFVTKKKKIGIGFVRLKLN